MGPGLERDGVLLIAHTERQVLESELDFDKKLIAVESVAHAKISHHDNIMLELAHTRRPPATTCWNKRSWELHRTTSLRSDLRLVPVTR